MLEAIELFEMLFLSFRSGIVERKKTRIVNERENRLPRENVKRARPLECSCAFKGAKCFDRLSVLGLYLLTSAN